MTAPQFIGEIDSDTMGLDGRRGRLRVVRAPKPRFIQNHYDEFDGGYDAANLSGLGKNPLKKLGKGLKKVVKSKAFKVVAGAAAAYYGGGALIKAAKSKGLLSKAKSKGLLSKAKGDTGLAKKGAKKASTLATLKKFAKKNRKAIVGTGLVVGAAALSKGNRADENQGRMVADPFTGKPVNYDALDPAMKDRVLMQQGSTVNSNGVPFGSGQTENPAFASQKIDIPQSAPFEYAKPSQAQESTAANLFDRFTNAQTVRSGGGDYGDGYEGQEHGQFAGSIDPKFLMIGAVALGALFLMGRKRG